MEAPRAKATISLPSFKSVIDGASWNRPDSGYHATPSYYAHQPQTPRNVVHDPVTPQQQRENPPRPHQYPSPAHSDDLSSSPEGSEMSRNPSWSSAAAPRLFKIDAPSPSSQPSEIESQGGDKAEEGLTPTIVHYRPKGVLSARSAQRISDSQRGKGKKGAEGGESSGELKIRMVKWDRTDKGTAPLKVPVRTVGPRVCTLCSIMKRKCERTDGVRPSASRPCAACQKNNFVCQFIAPSQLRDGTTQPPSLEHLKMHTTQAQRLATMALEEKVVKLETQLNLLEIENRILQGYVTNLRVYKDIVNAYVSQLKQRVREFDPGCELLGLEIPAMPEKPEKQRTVEEVGEMDVVQIEKQFIADESQGASGASRDASPDSDARQEGLVPLSDLVDGICPTLSQHPLRIEMPLVAESMDVDP